MLLLQIPFLTLAMFTVFENIGSLGTIVYLDILQIYTLGPLWIGTVGNPARIIAKRLRERGYRAGWFFWLFYVDLRFYIQDIDLDELPESDEENAKKGFLRILSDLRKYGRVILR